MTSLRLRSILVPVIASALIVSAAATVYAVASGERVIVRIQGTTAADNQRLHDLGFDIAAARPGEWTDIVASPGEVERLRQYGYPTVASRELPVSIPTQYHTYLEMLAELELLAANHPSIALLEDIGDAWGMIYDDPNNYPYHDIWALKISDNVLTDEAEPEILYTGVHHAREPVTLEICLGIASQLLNGYGSDPAIRRFVNDHETWIVPLVNPDGHWCVTDIDWTDWRKNLRDNDGDGAITPPGWWEYPDGVDNNRNYDWHWGGQGSSGNPSDQTYRGPFAFSEPENQAIRDLSHRENFAFSLDYHSYGELVLFPYGYDNTSNAPDEPLLQSIAQTVRDRIGGNYIAEQANQLYPAAGNSLDWHYGAYNSMAFLIETATSFIPDGNQIAGIVTANLRGAMYLQERVDGSGVRGIVRIEGIPGEATVTLVGVDNPSLNNSRRSHPVTGDYYRITQPGSRTLRFSVPGYDDQVFNLDVPGDTYVTLDVEFGIAGDVAAGEGATGLGLAVGPNPVRGSAVLRYALPSGISEARLALYDLTGRIVADRPLHDPSGTLTWEALDGDGRRLPAGVYLARLSAGDERTVRRLVLLP